MRAYFTLWLEQLEAHYGERDRRYEERFRGQETAVAAALAAQQKAVADALVAQEKLNAIVAAASERAISKAETAQQGVNERGNEFRKSLDDYTKQMMPRSESSVLMEGQAQSITDLRRELTLVREELRKDISSLRETRASLEGRDVVRTSDKLSGQWVAAIALGAFFSLSGLLVSIVTLILKLTGH